jgi:hypothetical protein
VAILPAPAVLVLSVALLNLRKLPLYSEAPLGRLSLSFSSWYAVPVPRVSIAISTQLCCRKLLNVLALLISFFLQQTPTRLPAIRTLCSHPTLDTTTLGSSSPYTHHLNPASIGNWERRLGATNPYMNRNINEYKTDSRRRRVDSRPFKLYPERDSIFPT